MLKVLLIGVMLVLTSAFGVVAWISLRPAPPPPVQAQAQPVPVVHVNILAAARQVAPGSLLKPEDIGTLAVTADAVPEGARTDTTANRSDLIGAMARHAVLPQQPLLPADILRPTDGGFLAAVLAPNTRAVSVAVDAVSGTAGLIWPGDRVDMILTQALDDQTVPAGRRTFGETVLKDLRVIAVDQQLARGASPDAATQGNRTVTLEVLPAAAERIAVAVRLGKIALAVRAAVRSQLSDLVGLEPARSPASGLTQVSAYANASALANGPSPAIWGQDVSPALAQGRRTGAGGTVHVFQGAASDKEYKFE